VSETIPTQFSGLVYAPNCENGVYLLMGLLWVYLPYQFAIEAFEIDDAKGKCYLEDKWTDINIEFKLYSSGLRRDIEKHPGVYADFRAGSLRCDTHEIFVG